MASFQKIDTALGYYYQQFGDYNYFDNNGIGKFLRYCNDNEFENNDIDDELADGHEDDCGYLDFDSNFPFRTPNLTESQKRSEIFHVLQHCYKYDVAPDSTAIDIDTAQLTGSPLSHAPKRKFKFASPRRAKRFILDLTHSVSQKSIDEDDPPPNPSLPTLHSYIVEPQTEPQPPQETLNDLQKLCRGIGIYYLSMNRDDYYDSDNIGKFTKWFEEEGMDINEMKEELIDGTMEDCLYLDFDTDPNSKINRFPLPSVIVNETKKSQKQFEIMAFIYKNKDGNPPNMHREFSINFDIESKDKKEAIKLYKAQCPRFIECFETEQDLMYLLAIGYWNNIPFALWMLDCFMRDRLREYLAHNGKQLTVNEWTQTVDSNGISEYINQLKTKYTLNGKHDIVTCIQTGIKAYISRIVPQFKFDMFCTIRDDLFEIAHYIEAATQFIIKIVNENGDTHAPFQWDFCVAVRDVTDKKGNILIPDGADLKDVLSIDQSVDFEDTDIIGDIKKKLKSNECPYYIQEVNTKEDDIDKSNLLIRCFWDTYNKFRVRNGIQFRQRTNPRSLNSDTYTVFPWMRRFCTLIDRRKWVTATEEKLCQSNDDSECEFHEEQDRNCGGDKKDDIYIWIPPQNCDKLPNDKNGYVSEVFMDNLNTCIIPRIGYNKSMHNADHFKIEDSFGVHKPTKCRLLTSTITSKNNCNERMLIFSFHIESIEEIRCYLWWKGCCLRFMPQDIVDVLPLMFEKKYKNNDKFTQNENIKDLVQQIQFKDKAFNKWRQKITNIKKQIY